MKLNIRIKTIFAFFIISLFLLFVFTTHADTSGNKQVEEAFRSYAEKENLRYTIQELKIGEGKEYILITTDVNYPDDPELTIWGYPIWLYRYEDGKVIEFSGQLAQSKSAGPWYLENEVLYTVARRGGLVRLEIDSDYNCERISDPQMFELEYGMPLPW